MAGVGEQGGILSCGNVCVAWHGHAEHKAQHGGGNKPVGADAERFSLAGMGHGALRMVALSSSRTSRSLLILRVLVYLGGTLLVRYYLHEDANARHTSYPQMM